MNLEQLKDAIVAAAVNWANTGEYEFTLALLVNEYFEKCGANSSLHGRGGVILNRKICVYEILRDCITPLSREDLRKLEVELMELVEDFQI